MYSGSWEPLPRIQAFLEGETSIRPELSTDDHELVLEIIRRIRPAEVQMVTRRRYLENLGALTIAHQMACPVGYVKYLCQQASRQLPTITESIRNELDGNILPVNN